MGINFYYKCVVVKQIKHENQKLPTPTNQHDDSHESDSNDEDDSNEDSDVQIEIKKEKKTKANKSKKKKKKDKEKPKKKSKSSKTKTSKKSKTKSESPKKRKKKKSKKGHSSSSTSTSSDHSTDSEDDSEVETKSKKSKKSHKTKKSKSKKEKKSVKKGKKRGRKKKQQEPEPPKVPKKRGRKKGSTKKKRLEREAAMEAEYGNDEKKKPKQMWIYKRILEKPIDDIFREVLPCPARQNDFKHLPMDYELPNWDQSQPPQPTWLNHFVYRDVTESNHNINDNTNSSSPKQEKQLTDPWIGDALMIYHFLFQFKDKLRMNDSFTMSEWIDCIRKNHETYLMNFVLSTFVAIIMDKTELKAKDKSELFNGYKCSLLTWPSLLKDFLNIRKRLMLVEDRVKDNAFNDVIDAIDASRPCLNDDNQHSVNLNNNLSTPFFKDISPQRKIGLLVMMMRYIVQDTKLFKHFFSKIANEADAARKKYLNGTAEESKRVRDEAKSQDKVMRGLHRSMPVHWSDFNMICKAEARDEKMPKVFMDAFYTKFFHSMSLEGANKGKVTKEDKERYKERLAVLIKLKNELEEEGEMIDCPQPQGLSKADPKTKKIKEKWRNKIQSNVEKIFQKYINEFVIEPETKKFKKNRQKILKTVVPQYNRTSGLSLGYDRYNNRYWVLANDFSKIIVENVNENRWGYFDKNEQIQQLLKFLNDKGRLESTLKINIMEKGVTYRIDKSYDTKWELTKWNSDNSNSQWICYPNWRYVLRFSIQQTNFFKWIQKDERKKVKYDQLTQQRQISMGNNNNNGIGKYHNDNVPFQVSVIKHFLLDLQWALHIGCSEEPLKAREIFRANVAGEYIDIDKLAQYVWKLFRSIDVLWKKKWLNPKALRNKLMLNNDDGDESRTYSNIMLCLFVIDNAIFYDESTYCKQLKNSTKRKQKLQERITSLHSDYNNNVDVNTAKSSLLSAITLTTSNGPKRRGRKPNTLNKPKSQQIKTKNESVEKKPIRIKRERKFLKTEYPMTNSLRSRRKRATRKSSPSPAPHFSKKKKTSTGFRRFFIIRL